MMWPVFMTIGLIAMALIIAIGAFFSGKNQETKRFEKELAEEENEKNRKILEANTAAMALSDHDLSQRLSKHNKGRKFTVYPGGRTD